MSFRIETVWPGDARGAVELTSIQPVREGLTVQDGAILARLTPAEHCYLTHGSPRGLKSRPRDALPVPSAAVRISIRCDVAGSGVSLWLLQFKGDNHLTSDRWALKAEETNVVWTPAPGADGIRIALRVAGAVAVKSLRIQVAPIAREARKAASPSGLKEAPREWLGLWEVLNGPKAKLPEIVESVLSARLRPETAIGPRPEHIRLEPTRTVGAAAYKRLQELGLKPDVLDFDSAPFGREISPKLMNALESRHYQSASPYSGERLLSADTFLISYPEGRPYVFVRFEAEERIFYDVYDGFGGARIGMYLPNENILVCRQNIIKAVSYLQYVMLRHAFDVARYLRSPERLTAIPINTMNHCGHWLLCEIEALSRIVGSHVKHVDEWIDCMFQFIDASRLLPAIEPSSSVIGSEPMFRNSLARNHFLVLPRIGNYFIGEQSKEAIKAYVADHKVHSGFETLVSHRLAGRWPVIWMEWRANDRLWVNQKEGLAALIDRLRSRYPDFAIVVAGWSRTNIERCEDELMIEKEEAVFSEIGASLKSKELHFVFGESLVNKLVWADNCDVYIVTHGTGVVFPLLADLSGIVVTNRIDLSARNESKSDLPEYVDGQHPFVFVPEALITDEVSYPNIGYALKDFRIDPKAFADFFEKAVLRSLERPDGR